VSLRRYFVARTRLHPATTTLRDHIWLKKALGMERKWNNTFFFGGPCDVRKVFLPWIFAVEKRLKKEKKFGEKKRKTKTKTFLKSKIKFDHWVSFSHHKKKSQKSNGHFSHGKKKYLKILTTIQKKFRKKK
jgi:hypothetical protein